MKHLVALSCDEVYGCQFRRETTNRRCVHGIVHVNSRPLTKSPTSAPLRPRRHWGRWCFLALLVGITVTAPTGWLPRLANALIREYLGVRDLSAIQVRVERLTPWNLRAAVCLGTNATVSQIDRIDVRFSPGGLWHARVERVEIDGGLLQFRAGTNGVVLCGLPSDLTRLRAGASPLDDEEFTPKIWRMEKVLLDNITVRLLPPEPGGSRGRSPSLSVENNLSENGGGVSSRTVNEEELSSTSNQPPCEVCLHASAVTDEAGETRITVADYGRVGLLANGAIRLDTGDGWLVAVLPENQVQEWLRAAQWFIRDPRFNGSSLCVGNGSATLLARMEQWRPVLVQGDLSLRAATLLQDFSFAYDLRVHGVAQWEDAATLRPTVAVNADLGMRMASGPAFAWSDDHELPAHASLDVKVTPLRAEWVCQMEARAALSREAVHACFPPAVDVTTGALVAQFDGRLTSPDLQAWGGEVNTRVMAPQASVSVHGVAVSCPELMLQATASIAESTPGGLHGRIDATGLKILGRGIVCEADANASFEARAPFELATLAATGRVSSLTLPAGTFAFNEELPIRATATATLRRGAGGAISISAADLQMGSHSNRIQIGASL